MARVHRVPKSRKEHTCTWGNHVIPKGDPYLHASPGFRRRHPIVRCLAHPFRPSELTTSAASAPMAAAEGFEDALDAINPQDNGALDELQTALEELTSAVEEYRDERQSALDAWENGNEQLQQYVDTAEAAVSEVEGIVIDEGDREALTDDEWAEHVESQIEDARAVVGGLEF